VKYSKAKQPTETPTSAATKQHAIAIPRFGYKNHAGIDRAHGFIRGWTVTAASAHDGAQLRNVVAKDNTASTVWADSAYPDGQIATLAKAFVIRSPFRYLKLLLGYLVPSVFIELMRHLKGPKRSPDIRSSATRATRPP
jgi:hypothetical protein